MLLHRNEDGSTNIIREKWHEYLYINVGRMFMRDIGMGTRLPRFFLPVKWDHLSHNCSCWILPLAPFVVVFNILKEMYHVAWRDFVGFLDDIRRYNEDSK